MKTILTFSVENELAEKLRQIAGEDDRSLSAILRKATKAYVEKNEGFNKPALVAPVDGTKAKDEGFNKPHLAKAA